jgi:hypothetical protein
MHLSILFLSSTVLPSNLITPTVLADNISIIIMSEDICGDIVVEIDDITLLDGGLTVEGEAMCLDGGKDAMVAVKAEGIANIVCENPAGKFPPGQQEYFVPIEVVGSESIDGGEIEEGQTVDFLIVADDIEDLEDPCPPPFTPHVVDISFTEVAVAVIQDGEVEDVMCEIDDNLDFFCD